MKRKMTSKLNNWKKEYSTMPFMLIGARQVGKTYILDEFCKQNFKNYIYINLERDDKVREIFKNSINPKDIINNLSIEKNMQIDCDNTVIFLDEIQVSERAITSLKYFNESNINYNIVCAGSMLGVALNRFKSSFPVGKVYREYLYSFDFEEFLWSVEEDLLSEEIIKSYKNNSELINPIHQKALKLYKDYLFIGGMPSSIIEYKKKNKLIHLYNTTIKRNIIEDYLNDMSKYTTNSEHFKIANVYRSIPRQLGRDNNKFNYKLLNIKGGKRVFESSIEWLVSSCIVNRCTLVESPRIPLVAYEKQGYFKIYSNDVGLLVELSNMKLADFVSNEANIYKGMLTENYVAQTLVASKIKLYYWRSSNNAEIDFIVHINGNVIPIEVKAANNTKAKSLKVYIEKYNPKYAIKVSAKNFGFVNNIKSVPLYAVHLIGKYK